MDPKMTKKLFGGLAIRDVALDGIEISEKFGGKVQGVRNYRIPDPKLRFNFGNKPVTIT